MIRSRKSDESPRQQDCRDTRNRRDDDPDRHTPRRIFFGDVVAALWALPGIFADHLAAIRARDVRRLIAVGGVGVIGKLSLVRIVSGLHLAPAPQFRTLPV